MLGSIARSPCRCAIQSKQQEVDFKHQGFFVPAEGTVSDTAGLEKREHSAGYKLQLLSDPDFFSSGAVGDCALPLPGWSSALGPAVWLWRASSLSGPLCEAS